MMGNRPKEFDLSLLQRDPGREAMLGKMRSKLAGFAPPAVPPPRRKAFAGRSGGARWAVRVLLLGAVVACNYLAFDKKDVLVAKISRKAVPSLAAPSPALSSDEQALYWTWAMYDIAKFRKVYGVTGYPAIDHAAARKRIELLLPEVSSRTLGEISRYMPVAFHSVSAGGRP
jgi:hypothetical protein